MKIDLGEKNHVIFCTGKHRASNLELFGYSHSFRIVILVFNALGSVSCLQGFDLITPLKIRNLCYTDTMKCFFSPHRYQTNYF